MSKWIFQLRQKSRLFKPLTTLKPSISENIFNHRNNSTDMSGRLIGKVAVVTASTDG